MGSGVGSSGSASPQSSDFNLSYASVSLYGKWGCCEASTCLRVAVMLVRALRTVLSTQLIFVNDIPLSSLETLAR